MDHLERQWASTGMQMLKCAQEHKCEWVEELKKIVPFKFFFTYQRFCNLRKSLQSGLATFILFVEIPCCPVEVRGQVSWVNCVFLPYRFWESNLGHWLSGKCSYPLNHFSSPYFGYLFHHLTVSYFIFLIYFKSINILNTFKRLSRKQEPTSISLLSYNTNIFATWASVYFWRNKS